MWISAVGPQSNPAVDLGSAQQLSEALAQRCGVRVGPAHDHIPLVQEYGPWICRAARAVSVGIPTPKSTFVQRTFERTSAMATGGCDNEIVLGVQC